MKTDKQMKNTKITLNMFAIEKKLESMFQNLCKQIFPRSMNCSNQMLLEWIFFQSSTDSSYSISTSKSL